MANVIVDRQDEQDFTLQLNATTNGNGTPAFVGGKNGATTLWVVNTDAAGTCTLTIQGSNDGANWVSIGYQRIDAVAAPARSVSAFSVTANLVACLQILDYYKEIRAVISAATGFTTGNVNVTGVAVAM